jgi:hypothetical protein
MSSLYLRDLSSGRAFELKKEVMKLGRASDSEIAIIAPSISRHHATLYLADSGLVIEDAGSQNGVRVNRKPIAVATSLKLGDRIEVGGMEMEVTDNPQGPTVRLAAAPAAPERREEVNFRVRSVEKKPVSRTLLFGSLAVFVALMALMLLPDPSANRNPAGVEGGLPPLTKDDLTKALNSDSYTKGNHILKTPTEVEAESRFKQAMRDYYNGNYSRSIVVLKQALVANPSHEEAAEYLQFAERRLNNQIDTLMKSGQRSYSVLQYSRARSEFSQVLSILSEQIPGYWQRVSSDLNTKEGDDRRPAQEEVLLQIPCDKTKRKESCKLAVDMIRLCRKLLGDEDVLK